MPIDLVMRLSAEETTLCESPDDYVARLQRNSGDAFQLERKHLRAHAERRRQCYNIRVKHEQFTVGNWAFYHNPRRYHSKSLNLPTSRHWHISDSEND